MLTRFSLCLCLAGASANAPATGPAVDSIVLIYGPGSDDGDEYDRTLAIHNFLFGYEFADTAIAFCRDPDTVVIITSPKKCKILEAIGKDDKPVPIKLQIHATNKGDKNAANIVTFINKLKASKSGVSHATHTRWGGRLRLCDADNAMATRTRSLTHFVLFSLSLLFSVFSEALRYYRRQDR